MLLDRLRGHQLLPNDLREQLPPLYSQEALGLQAQAILKLFTPRGGFTWYASEGSPVDADGYYDTDKAKVDFLFFGLVAGLEIELGYFALSELDIATDETSLPIVERDLHFKRETLAVLMAKHQRQ